MACSKADFVFFFSPEDGGSSWTNLSFTPLVDIFGNLFKSLGKLLDTLNLFSEGLTELFSS